MSRFYLLNFFYFATGFFFILKSSMRLFKIIDKHFRNELECGSMPNVMAAQPKIGGALCWTGKIPLVDKSPRKCII